MNSNLAAWAEPAQKWIRLQLVLQTTFVLLAGRNTRTVAPGIPVGSICFVLRGNAVPAEDINNPAAPKTSVRLIIPYAFRGNAFLVVG